MKPRTALLIALAAWLSGALTSWLYIWGDNVQWQLQGARCIIEFTDYQRQVAPAIQMYNQAMSAQQAPADDDAPEEGAQEQ